MCSFRSCDDAYQGEFDDSGRDCPSQHPTCDNAADAIILFAEENSINLERDVDIIAGQGQVWVAFLCITLNSLASICLQTIWHLPLPDLFEGNQIRSHLDVSEIAIIAARTGITSLSQFRVGDMALGRQGCPLFAALDSLLLNHPTLNRAVQNIGGIANFSILPAGDIEGCWYALSFAKQNECSAT
jgi:Anhydro-N-acetylmuramic acid kinase